MEDKPITLDEAAEKEVMIQAFDKVRQLFERRSWIMDGRGNYRYDDDSYKHEVRYMYDEFDALQKDVWKNIKSKSVDFRNKVIAEWQSQQKETKPTGLEIEKLWDLNSRSVPEDGYSIKDLDWVIGKQIMFKEDFIECLSELNPPKPTGLRWVKASESLDWLPLEKFLHILDNVGCKRLGNFFKDEGENEGETKLSICGTEMYESYQVAEKDLDHYYWLSETEETKPVEDKDVTDEEIDAMAEAYFPDAIYTGNISGTTLKILFKEIFKAGLNYQPQHPVEDKP